MSNHYHFLTRWRLQGTPEEIYDILSQPLEYPRWWPSVYLQVEAVPGSIQGANGPDGKFPRFRLHTKGLLPWTLRWDAVTIEAGRPHRLVIRALGDLNGRGIWSIVPDGKFADVTFDWKVTAAKPLLHYFSFALKPAFELNHRWAMRQGFDSLSLELRRSRAQTVEEMNAIPAPEKMGTLDWLRSQSRQKAQSSRERES